MLRRFAALYWYELRGSRAAVLVVLAMILAWDVFLLSRRGHWQGELIVALAAAPLLAALPWSAYASFRNWNRQWQDNTVYLSRSLPVPAWHLAAAKLLGATTETVVIAGIAVAGFLPFWLPTHAVQGAPALGELFLAANLANGARLALLAVVGVLAVTALVQVAWALGRLAGRYGLLAFLMTGVVGAWIHVRLGGALATRMPWAPRLAMRGVSGVGGIYQLRVDTVSTAPFLCVLMISATFFVLGAWLVEHHLDV